MLFVQYNIMMKIYMYVQCTNILGYHILYVVSLTILINHTGFLGHIPILMRNVKLIFVFEQKISGVKTNDFTNFQLREQQILRGAIG